MSPRQPAPDPHEAQRGDPTDDFAREVHRALAHLHDLAYLQTLSLQPLAPSTRSSLHRYGLSHSLRQGLVEAIDSLRPSRLAPGRSHSSRLHELLQYRYVDALEIDEVCDRLGISRSEYFRDHRRAADAVCSILSESWTLSDKLGAERAELGHTGRAVLGRERNLRAEPTARATNLPTLLTSFVGREQELAELSRLLGQTRLLTLTGTGGCGKTRLALESARSLLECHPDAYPDGVWLVQLAPIADPALVPLAIASALDVVERAGESIVGTLTRYLQPRQTLLLLDNCEHVLDASARVSETLLESCPSLSILATSRQPLGIGGEIVLHVPSLDSPPTDEGQRREALLEAVLSHDASRLFLDRARSVLPAFDPTLSNAAAIADICRRLDGIPLAIELAAARVRALSPDQIAARLDHDFHLLTSGSRTALPRQQTLKATLDWSYDLLSARERAILRRLAVFAGGFILEAAEGVCRGDGIEELDVANLLAELVDKSLVEVDVPEGEDRYRLLEPVRQYAWHRLEESGEVDAIQRKHARWLAGYVELTEDVIFSPEEVSWLSKVAPENDNVRTALSWCLDNDPGLGLALAGQMWTYWLWRGVKSERHRWLDGLLARDPQPSGARYDVLFNAAGEAGDDGDYDRATALASEALAIALEHGAEREACWPLNLLAILAAEKGDRALARSYLEQAEALGRKHGNAKSLAQTLVYGSYVAWLAGDDRRSHLLLDEALPAWRCLGSPNGYAYARVVAGVLACSEGDNALARVLLEEGLEIWRSVRLLPDVAVCLTMLGYVSLREGDLEAARRDVASGLRLAAPMAHRPRISRCLTFMALLASREGDAVRAARLAGASEAIHPYVRNLFSPDQRADLDTCLAYAGKALGEAGYARAYAEGRAMTLDQAVEYALGE